MKRITYLLFLFFSFNYIYTQSIFNNPITDANPSIDNPYTNGQTLDANISVSGISRGVGIGPNTGTNRYNARNWNTPTLDATDFFEFTLTPNPGYEINFVSFVYLGQASGTGPVNFAFRSSLDGYTANIGTAIENGTTIDLSASVYQNITSPITFRFYAWGASGAAGTFSINDFTFNGVVSLACLTTTIWDSGAWDNGLPNSTSKNVIINDDYNTSSGNITACSLTVNAGFTLTVANGDYIEVGRNTTIDGQLHVESEGNFVQNNDAALFTDNSTNGVQLTKTKSMFRKSTYTYWSSPVVGEDIEDTFTGIPTSRRFYFEAANFVDTMAEVGNTGTFTMGQDDIDDNGDDWLLASGTMQPGRGYSTIARNAGSYPDLQSFVFTGAFNNGEVLIPLVNASGGTYNDWNFIGNPYPGPIDVSTFLSVNTGVISVVYFWDQATPESSTAGGSQGLNFSSDDYAMHNGIGGIGARGGTGNVPNDFIASGQGFFVEAESTGNAIFNNSMRDISHNNTQFFKNINKKSNTTDDNKLWINLTSDNGIFNQILIGYVNGASNNNDGAFYDAKRVLSVGNAAILYSLIGNNTDKFAIQGKAVNSLDNNETISLGFKTTIDATTPYKLSIQELQGTFLNTNTIYLKDNLLNILHNLSNADYTFNSEIGEFNDRFEIVFNGNALYTNDVLLDTNSLQIIESENDNVTFNTSNNLSIKSIHIFDLSGRQLYHFNGRNSSETYSLSNLQSTVYIAKVKLSNEILITRKFIKK